MSKINCGIGELKKGERRGTMKECADKGQVRYYGLKKIDSRILNASKKINKNLKSRNQLLKKIMSLKAKILSYKKKIKEEKDSNKKESTSMGILIVKKNVQKRAAEKTRQS